LTHSIRDLRLHAQQHEHTLCTSQRCSESVASHPSGHCSKDKRASSTLSACALDRGHCTAQAKQSTRFNSTRMDSASSNSHALELSSQMPADRSLSVLSAPISVDRAHHEHRPARLHSTVSPNRTQRGKINLILPHRNDGKSRFSRAAASRTSRTARSG
jgi:hypothetical protein